MLFRRIFGLGTGKIHDPAAIRQALTTGNFHPLHHEKTAGTLLVHGINIPKPAPGKIVAETASLSFREYPQLVVARNVVWRDVAFTNSTLPRTSLQGCSLQNVVFRQCDLTSWRFFSVRAEACTFSDTNLQGTAFSVMTNEEETVFAGCRFIRCDLRETAYKNARFENCTFEDCQIVGVDFSPTAFIDVRFSGEISDTIFRGQRANYTQINPMLRVDFSSAKLSWVEFYAADLTQVIFPSGEDQITIENWDAFLDALDRLTVDATETQHRQVRAILGVWRKVRGENQNRGFVNLKDIATAIGPIGVGIFKAALEISRTT